MSTSRAPASADSLRLEAVATDPASLARYAGLFADCFPQAGHLRERYLGWLYRDNPDGLVIGFDAWDGERLAAHYVCVPAPVRLDATAKKALLSLNTATHPDYQGRGLFTKLADATYRAAEQAGYELVFGFANQNSTPGFVRKLGFDLVAPIDSWIGVGRMHRVDWSAVEAANFARAWTPESLAWRAANPARPLQSIRLGDRSAGFFADTGRIGIRAFAQLPPTATAASDRVDIHLARVMLGLFPHRCHPVGAYLPIPRRLRPSPMNLIVRGLSSTVRIDPRDAFVSFLDFDAF